jgi:cell division protein FtsI (penicillin-binding protein 3)
LATLAARLERPAAPRGDERQGLALTHQRLMLVLLLFIGVTALIVLRLAWLQVSTDRTGAVALADPLIPPRADIVDRNGIPLARTIEAWSIGVHPRRVIGNRAQLAERLHALMPERSAAAFLQLLRPDANFRYIARRAVPELVDRVNALGEPGIVFDREPERLYPQTALAGHVLGWVDRDGHGVAGVERSMEARLTDPRLRGAPLELAIDSRVQATLESELDRAVTAMEAEGGTGIIMDVHTGEVVAMASAPTFNPNAVGQADASALYNRATMGVYELGSTFKPITVAAALEAGVITSLSQRWDASAPLAIGRFRIHDDHPMGRALTVPEILVHSSNIASARIADAMGADRMQAAFRALGFDRPADIELDERSRTLWPSEWGRARVLTSGFGHGIAITPLHLATAYCALVNGGIWRPATLLRVDPGHAAPGRRVYSAATSLRIRQMLRMIVTNGTGRNANVPGFRVGGKTGTAEKVTAHGGYNHHVNVSTFAAAFPMDEPRYVVLVMMDAPRPNAANHFVTTAAYTAAPVVARVIARIGPLVGVIPDERRDIDVSALMPLLGGGDSAPTDQ